MKRNYVVLLLKKIIPFLFFSLSFSIYSQQTVKLSGKLQGFDYSATINYKFNCYMGVPYVPAELKVTLNGFSYKGKYYKGTAIKGYRFPMVGRGYLKIKAVVQIGDYRLGNFEHVDLSSSKLTINYVNSDAIPHMKDDFRLSKEGKAYLKKTRILLCSDWVKKAVQLRDVEVIGGHFEAKSLGLASELRSVIDKMLKTEDFESAIQSGMTNASYGALDDAKSNYKTALSKNPYTANSKQQLAKLKQSIRKLEKDSKKKKNEDVWDTLEEETSKTDNTEVWTSLDETKKTIATKKETSSNNWGTLTNNTSVNSKKTKDGWGDVTSNKKDDSYKIDTKDDLSGVIHPLTKKILIPYKDWSILEYKPAANMAKIIEIVSQQTNKIDCVLNGKIYVFLYKEGYVGENGGWILDPINVAKISYYIEEEKKAGLILRRATDNTGCDAACQKRRQQREERKKLKEAKDKERERKCKKRIRNKYEETKRNYKSQGYDVRWLSKWLRWSR